MTKENKFIPYKIANFSSEELIEKSKKYFQEINKRRSTWTEKVVVKVVKV